MSVVSLEELSSIVAKLREEGKIVVHCHGVFDVLHVGHLQHFEESKNHGDILVVTVTPDIYVNKGPDRPLFSEELRARMVSGVGIVDYVSINKYPTAVDTIKIIRPNIYAKGSEYNGLVNDAITDEESAITFVGGKIVFTSGLVFSSSKIINSFNLTEKSKNYINNFKYSYSDVVYWIDKVKDISVLVIGEIIMDSYQYGESIGKAGKSPIVAFKLGNSELYEGGTLAIRNHLRDFVKEVSISKSNTIIKKRYIEGNQKIFETYELDENHPHIEEEVSSTIGNYDLVIVADFGHGLLTKELRDIIKEQAKFLAVATQRNAGNMGHNTIRKYWDRKDNIYICIDDDELRLAVHEKYSRGHDLRDIIKNELVPTSIITGGPDGCIANDTLIPAMTTNVVDTVGAGDAFLSITSPLMCVGAPMELVGFIGCVAGALKVSYSGNKNSITKKDLLSYTKTLLKGQRI
jgi:cytidyltransferase-like protein